MKKAHPKDDLPPVTAESVFLKEVRGDLREGSSYVGSQSFRRFIRHLAAQHKAEAEAALWLLLRRLRPHSISRFDPLALGTQFTRE